MKRLSNPIHNPPTHTHTQMIYISSVGEGKGVSWEGMFIFTLLYLKWITNKDLLDSEDALEKGMATHSSILAWRIPWTEVPGGLHIMGSQTVRQD